jgi:cyanate permease
LERKSSRHRIFLGWWTVLFLGTVSGLGQGFNIYGISVFFKDIAAELELNRAFTALAAGIGRFEGGVISPLVGWLADKFGPRVLVVIGVCIAASGMIFMNFITEVWQYYVAWGVLISNGLYIGLTVSVDKTVTDWFIRRRGLAQGIKFALIGVFGVITLQIVTPLVAWQGWRFTCLIWGILMLASVPFALTLVKPRRPEYYGLLPDGADFSLDTVRDEGEIIARGVSYASSLQETEYSFKQTLRTGPYWLLVIGFTVHYMISGGFNPHVVPFLTDFGIELTVAGSMMGLMVFFTIPSRFFSGFLADRVPKNRLQFLLMGAFLFQIIGISVFLTFRNLPAVYVLLACHGLSTGSVPILTIFMLGRFFGRKAFGATLGFLVAIFSPLGMAAPWYYGWVFDTRGNYDVALITALALVLLAMITSFFIRAPRQPVNVTDR